MAVLPCTVLRQKKYNFHRQTAWHLLPWILSVRFMMSYFIPKRRRVENFAFFDGLRKLNNFPLFAEQHHRRRFHHVVYTESRETGVCSLCYTTHRFTRFSHPHAVLVYLFLTNDQMWDGKVGNLLSQLEKIVSIRFYYLCYLTQQKTHFVLRYLIDHIELRATIVHIRWVMET